MKQLARKSGFSIIEIVIAVIIIGVLTLILVPVLSKRAHEARINACQTELEHLGDAEERVAIDTGYYVRLYALDDLKQGDDRPLGSLNPRDIDGLPDEDQNTMFYQQPARLFINPETNEFLSFSAAQNVYDSLVYETSYKWGGPYFNIHRDETAYDHNPGAPRDHLHDIPNDPWENDYLFFLRTGIVKEPEGEIRQNITIDGASYDTLVFDRPTVLSTGPDGLPGDGGTNFGEGDDLYRSFGY